MARPGPDREYVPPVQKLRIRYAKRGRLRFASHRDFQRALERGLRRAKVPMAYSAGFSPHPKISYANAAPTGSASEAEYLEIGVLQRCDPDELRTRLDEVLPEGIDIVDVVEAGPGDLVSRLEASRWRIELVGDPVAIAAAVSQFLEQDEVFVERITKSGAKQVDVRGPVLSMEVTRAAQGATCEAIVRNVTPTVRPDDLVRAMAGFGLKPAIPAVSTRLEQGRVLDPETIGDPLEADRARAVTE